MLKVSVNGRVMMLVIKLLEMLFLRFFMLYFIVGF